jgi:exosortase
MEQEQKKRTLRWYVVPLTAVALLICYASTLRGMIDQWLHDEDMAHGFVVPLVIGWVIWRGRDAWRSLPVSPSRWGFVILALAAGLDFAGAVGVGLFARSVAFLMSIAGAILCLGGFAWLRATAFPFVLALFMLPKLAIVYNQITLPMQLLASRLAAGLLTTLGFTVLRAGNILSVAGHQIAVVEACDGIRYLIPLFFSAVVFGYLTDSALWTWFALLISAVPLAIIANGIRVAAAAPIPALATGLLHTLAGWFIFILCLATLLLMHRLIEAVSARYHA